LPIFVQLQGGDETEKYSTISPMCAMDSTRWVRKGPAPLSIDFTGTLNFDPAPVTSFSHKLIYTPQLRDGPMSITVEFKIDCARGPEFLSLMRAVRLIHLRNGAYSWRLHEDLTRSNTFRLELIVPSWNEHLLQRERMTKAEKEVLVETWSLHMGATPPEERIYLSVSNELHTPRQCTFNASTSPQAGKYVARPGSRARAVLS
jgi:transmembrane secretion effector